MSFFEAVKTALTKYAVFSGRARRKEYWYFLLFNALVGFIIGFLGAIMQKPKAMSTLNILFTLAFLLPSIAVAVRRLHDTGRSGLWYLLAVPGIAFAETSNLMMAQENLLLQGIFALVSLVFSIVLIVFYCQDSQPGTNRFGPNPKGVLDNDTTQRIFQAAAAHEPPYIYLDPDMTTLDPLVTAAMRRVFPGYLDGTSLDAALLSQPQPELQTVDTDTLLVLLKFAMTTDPAAAMVRVRTLQSAILTELAERGI